MKPTKGRKSTGTLEGYKEGVRFVCQGEHTDILFKNVKHAIIHPANNDVCGVGVSRLRDKPPGLMKGSLEESRGSVWIEALPFASACRITPKGRVENSTAVGRSG